MRRFYCPQYTSDQKSIDITNADEVHHLKNVLRLKQNDSIIIFNGRGEEAEGFITEMTKKNLHLSVQNSKKTTIEKPRLILACAIPKKTKFEWIIEKTTELGIDEIIPLNTKRTELKLPPNRMDAKLKRFETVAINAAKQSQRATVPHIHPVLSLEKALALLLPQKTTIFIPSLTGQTKPIMKAFEQTPASDAISFFIGPEGDFTSEEYQKAHQYCIPISLGATILKVETAAITSVACAKFFYRSQ